MYQHRCLTITGSVSSTKHLGSTKNQVTYDGLEVVIPVGLVLGLRVENIMVAVVVARKADPGFQGAAILIRQGLVFSKL